MFFLFVVVLFFFFNDTATTEIYTLSLHDALPISAIGSVFVIGLTIPMADGPIMAIFQTTVAPEMQGRVFALLGSLISLSSPLGLAVAGPVSDWLGVQIWFVIAGILCITVGLIGFLIPAIIHIEENHQAKGLVKEGIALSVETSSD